MARFLLTASTSPLAVAMAHHLVAEGHEVVALARAPERATQLPEGVALLEVDLADPERVDAAELPDVDGVMHLAGILGHRADPVPHGWPQQPTVDRVWATNVLGPLRLVHRLLPRLPDGAAVSLISGSVHRRASLPDAEFRSTGLRASAQAATAKVAWTRALARRRPDLVATTFCPGRVAGNLHRGLPWPLSALGGLVGRSAAPGSSVAPWLASLLLGGHPSGTYVERGERRAPAAHTDDEGLQDAVWGRVASWATEAS